MRQESTHLGGYTALESELIRFQPNPPVSPYATLDSVLLRRALGLALDDSGIDKLRMVCWIVAGVEWNDAVAGSVGKPLYELPAKSVVVE